MKVIVKFDTKPAARPGTLYTKSKNNIIYLQYW